MHGARVCCGDNMQNDLFSRQFWFNLEPKIWKEQCSQIHLCQFVCLLYQYFWKVQIYMPTAAVLTCCEMFAKLWGNFSNKNSADGKFGQLLKWWKGFWLITFLICRVSCWNLLLLVRQAGIYYWNKFCGNLINCFT